MKTKTIQIVLLLLVCSCNLKQVEEAKREETSPQINPVEVSTAYEFPDLEFPDNFYLDSMTIYDAKSRANYTAYYIQSNLSDKKRFNQAMLQSMHEQILTEQKYVEPYHGNSPIDIIFSYQLRPIEIYADSQIISISNIIDTYTEGGNHHNYTRRTFNYNPNEDKTINFNDIFKLQSKNDSTEFIAYVAQHTEGCKEWTWHYEYLDFSFTKNGISLHPSLSWACSSTRALLPHNSTNKFIRKKWIKNNTTSKINNNEENSKY